MLDPTAPPDTPCLPITSRSTLPPSYAFDLGRLPAELRAKVIREAAVLDCRSRYTENSKVLMTVSKEFHLVAAPFAWDVLVIEEASTSAELQRLVESILPRYGCFVKRTSLLWWDPGSDPSDFKFSTIKLVDQVMAGMPNLKSLVTNPSLWDVVSNSPHLPSLTHLEVDSRVAPTLVDLATLISQCPNVARLVLNLPVKTSSKGRSHVMAAIATRRSLTYLELDAGLLNGSASRAEWVCPLSHLVVIQPEIDGCVPVSLPNLRTFVSHFSTTLTRLKIDCGTDLWEITRAKSAPLPLPNLVRLALIPDHPSLNCLLLLRLFDDSPLKIVELNGRPSRTRDDIICRALRHFMAVHEETLEYFHGYSIHWDGSMSEGEVKRLKAHARRSGIKFRLPCGFNTYDYSSDPEAEY